MSENNHKGMKKCSKCGEWKPATAEFFNRNKTRVDGLQSMCKDCCREYRQKNREKLAERKREYYQKNKEKIADSGLEYKRSNVGRLSDAVNKIREKTGATIYLRDMTDEEKETLANQYVAVITLEKTEKELLSASGKKRCTKCDRILDYDCFHKSNDGYAGLKSYCKGCRLKMTRKYYQQNKEKIKDYYQKNKDKVKEYRRKYYQQKKALDKIESIPDNGV